MIDDIITRTRINKGVFNILNAIFIMLYMIYSASLPKRIKGGQEFMIEIINTRTIINKVFFNILNEL